MKSRTERFAESLAILAEAFRQKLSQITLRAYDLGTKDIEIDRVEAAVLLAITNCKFMPNVAELRELAGVRTGGANASDRALVAWGLVLEAVRQHGAYASVTFDDPVIPATIRAICSGWAELCDTPSDTLHNWTRKAFIETYRALSAAGQVSAIAASPLSGLLAQDAVRGGYDKPDAVRIGAIIPAAVKVLPAEEPKRISQSDEFKPVTKSQRTAKRITTELASMFKVTAEDESDTDEPAEPAGITVEETKRRAAEQKARLLERYPSHQPGKAPS